jgi:hypothetical protein
MNVGVWNLLSKGEQNVLKGFTDVDWVRNVENKKSTSGNLFLLRTVVVTWNSQKQPTIVLSSIEVEYIALIEGVK